MGNSRPGSQGWASKPLNKATIWPALLAIATCFVTWTLGALLYLSGFWIIIHPAYKETLSFAQRSSRVRDLLGDHVITRLGARGTVNWLHSGYAHVKIPVQGTKVNGTIYALLSFSGHAWQVSDLSVDTGDPGKMVTISNSHEVREDYPARSTVYILPLGHPDILSIQSAVDQIRRRFGVTIQMLPGEPLRPEDVDPVRHQLLGDHAYDLVARRYPEISSDYDACVIVVTDRDLYFGDSDFNLAFRYGRRFSVISTARLGQTSRFDVEAPLYENVRLRKMMARSIAIQALELPESDDPTSLLVSGISGAHDVDLMTEDVLGASGRWTAPAGLMPCLDLYASRERAPSWHIDCLADPPHDISAFSFTTYLKGGYIIQGHTDFHLGKKFPVQFKRMLNPADDEVFAFGHGGNHSFDLFLFGDPDNFSYIDLATEDGLNVTFKPSKRGGGFKDVVFVSVAGGAFDGATLTWNGHGWDLKRFDGITFVFPAAKPGVTTYRQSGMTAMMDDKGHSVRMVRDKKGNLLKAIHSEGDELTFTYDSLNRITHAEDNHGRAIDYAYDHDGRLAQVNDNDRRNEQYVYDSHDRVEKVLWDSKVILSNEYANNGFLIRQTDAEKKVFSYEYRVNGKEVKSVKFVSPDGYTSIFSIGEFGATGTLPKRLQGPPPRGL